MEPQFVESAHPNPIERPRKGERRFRIVKLEEPIAPNQGGIPGETNGSCDCYRGTHACR
jgi:hypothetical protein